ncbi:MAG: hypothetical protein WKG07_40935 [Hymenobacter sp.]
MQAHAEEAVHERMKTLQRQFDSFWRNQGRNPWVDDEGNEIPDFIETQMKRTESYKTLADRYKGQPAAPGFGPARQAPDEGVYLEARRRRHHAGHVAARFAGVLQALPAGRHDDHGPLHRATSRPGWAGSTTASSSTTT